MKECYKRASTYFGIAIKKHRIGHSYIFVGENEKEKKRIGIDFAQMLNCKTKEGEICETCYSCRKIGELAHPDLKVIIPEESLKIDEIRQLQRWISLKPYSARWKVALILKGELLTEEAANALLKTLEEPPTHSLLIISVCNTENILSTIVSRCQIIRLNKYLSPERIEKKTENNIQGDPFKYIDEKKLSKSKEEWGEIFRAALYWCRDVLILKSNGREETLFNRQKIGKVKEQAEKYSLIELENKIETITKTYNLLRNNANPKIAFANMRLELI